MNRITLKLDKQLYARVGRAAEHYRMPVATLVRDCLRAGLQAKEPEVTDVPEIGAHAHD